DAIGLANASLGASTIEFDSTVFSTPLSINLTSGQLELSDTNGSETIMGPAAGVTVSGAGTSRVFAIDANVTAAISGLTIAGGRVSGNGGGLANFGGAATLTDCTISGNTAASGGGVYTGPDGTTTLNNCSVIGNSAYGNGGGLYDFLGSISLSNCTISG